MDRTTGFRAKYRQAKKRLAELEDVVGTFGEPDSYRVFTDLHIDEGVCLVYARPQAEEDRIAEWGVLVGEIIHNLRSALDLLAYQLACLKHDPPTCKTEFPVYWEKKPHSAQAKVKCLYKKDRLAIEALQPYERSPQAPKRDPLWILHDLSNLEKHRLPPLTVVMMSFDRLRPRYRGLEVLGEERLSMSGAFTEEAAIARYDVKQTGPDPDMNVEAYGSFGIVFGEGTPAAKDGLFKTLDILALDVQQILLSFTSRFN